MSLGGFPGGTRTVRGIAKWLGIAAVVALLAAAGIALYVYFASERILAARYEARPERLPDPTEAQRADAGRQVRLLGCISCHGEGLSGKILVDAPRLARLYASNLTQVATEYSDEQLAQGIRQGLRKDGRALWVMPSKTFSRLSETETAAIVEFIRSLPAARTPTPSLAIGPLGRLGLVRGAFKPEPVNVADYQRRPPLNAGAEHDAGRHLAATICAHCHGPDLAGNTLASSQAAPDLAIVGTYELSAFATLMKTGIAAGGRELGLMSRIARADLSNLTDQEIAALYAYLRARSQR